VAPPLQGKKIMLFCFLQSRTRKADTSESDDSEEEERVKVVKKKRRASSSEEDTKAKKKKKKKQKESSSDSDVVCISTTFILSSRIFLGYVVPRLRICAAVPPLLRISAWHYD
jgi:hypothetical protein